MVVRVAVVGVGRWGRNHVRVLKELEKEGTVKLATVCDIDRRRAENVAKEYGVEGIETDYREIPRYDVDGVIVASSIDSLAPIAKYMIENGINVLVEKPVATTLKDVYEMLEIAKNKNVVVMPGMIMRFSPTIKKLKEIIMNSSEVKYIVFKRRSRRPLDMRKYSIVLDLAVHDIDLCRYLTNSSTLTHISSTIVSTDIDDILISILRSEKGVVCVLNIDGVSPYKVREIDVIGNSMTIRVDTDKNTITMYRDGVFSTLDISSEEPLKNEVKSFVMRIMGYSIDIPTLMDSIEYLKIVEEILLKAARVS